MSLSNAIDQIETVLEAISGLSRHPDEKAEAIDGKGHQDLDGAFSLYAIGAPEPQEEIWQTPSAFWQTFGVDVATKIKVASTRKASDKTANTRGVAVLRALIGATSPGADCHAIYLDGPPEIINVAGSNKLLIWRAKFRLHYTEA